MSVPPMYWPRREMLTHRYPGTNNLILPQTRARRGFLLGEYGNNARSDKADRVRRYAPGAYQHMGGQTFFCLRDGAHQHPTEDLSFHGTGNP